MLGNSKPTRLRSVPGPRGPSQPAAEAAESLLKKPNYSFEKRQREAAKQKKKEAKRLKKLGGKKVDDSENAS